MLSPVLRHFAAAFPSYNEAALGWHITNGSAPTATNVAVLAAWTVGFAHLPLAVRRRGLPTRASASQCDRGRTG